MTWEYLHLVAHPFPIVLALTGVGTGIVGWVLGREELELYATVSLLLAGVLSVPAYYTGIAAADTVASRTFVEPSLVETHRTWATWAGVGMVTTAVFAGFSLWQGARRPEDRRLRRFVLLMGALSGAVVAYAAWIGGHIVHGEPGTEETNVTDTSAMDSLEERARRLHREALVADGHNDLPWRIREEAGLDVDSLRLPYRGLSPEEGSAGGRTRGIAAPGADPRGGSGATGAP